MNKDSLDRYITGNYGEDQFRNERRAPVKCICCKRDVLKRGEKYCGDCGGQLSTRGECVLCQCRRQGFSQ